jgi:hypothetical protein
MIGTLWHHGVSIDPGRLVDETDTAYYLTVVASYRHWRQLKEQEYAEQQRQSASAGA